MTHEEKQLLTKVLCEGLPYGVKVKYYSMEYPYGSKPVILTPYLLWDRWANINEMRPQLRPMSSMTDDEREEIEVFIFNKWYQENSCKIDKEGWIEILANYDVSGIDPCFCSDYVDWLNAHHFDHRGLIEKGLALEAPEGMYD